MTDLPLKESDENNNPTENSASNPEPKKGLGWAWKSAIFLLVILTVIQLIFRFYSDEIIGRVLKEIVSIKSDGLYRITYDQISFDLFGQELEIDDFRLIPNRRDFYDAKSQLWKTKNNVYEASIPHIRLTGASVIDLYVNDILNINEFKVHEPNLTAYIHKKDSLHRDQRMKINDLHFLIADRLKYFSVKELEVDRASVSLEVPDTTTERQKYLFQNVSLSAINFLIDSASIQKDKRPFSVEDIHLKARYNLIKLPNTPYSLQFEDLEFSTYAASFTVMGLRLNCDEDARLGQGEFSERNVADIYIPHLRGTGVDYRSIYFNKEIHVNQLKLKKPEVSFYTKKGRKVDPIKAAERVYKNISKQFKSVEVEKILIDRGFFGFNQNNEELFYAGNTTGELLNFVLDSATHRERGKFFFLDDINLAIKEYELPLHDRLHTIRSNDIGISTVNKSLYARNLEVSCPYSPEQLLKMDTSGDIQSVNLKVPLIQLKQFDIKKAYINRELDASSLFMYQPKLSFFKHVADSLPVEQSTDSLARIKDFYPYIKPIFNRIRIGSFYLKEGNGLLTRQFGEQNGVMSIDSASIWLSNLRIDPYSKFRENTFLNTTDIRFDFADIQLIRPDSLYCLNIGRFKAAQGDSSIVLEDIHMKPVLDNLDFTLSDSLKLPPTFLDVKLNRLKVDSIDLVKAYYDGYVEINELKLSKPTIKVFKNPSYNYDEVRISPHEKLEEFIGNNFHSLVLNRITLDSGRLALVEDPAFQYERMSLDSINVFLNNLIIDSSTLMMPQVLFIMDTFQFDSRDYRLLLPDSIHELTIDRFSVSSAEKEAFAQQIMLKADSSRLSPTCNRYSASIPSFKLKGFDPKLLYYDKILEVDSFLIPSPKIEMQLWKLEKDKAHTSLDFREQWEKLFELFSPTLKAVEIKNTWLDSGYVRIVQNGLGKGQALEMEELLMNVSDFMLDDETKVSAARLLYADNVLLKAKNFYHFLPDSTYTIHFGEVGFSAKEGNLWGLQVNVHPLKQPASENYINAYIPDFQLEGVDLYRLYKKEGVAMKRLGINAPWVKNTTFPKAQTQSFDLDDIYPAIAPFTPSLQIDQIELAKGDFYWQAYKKLQPDKYHLGKLYLDVVNFKVDSTTSTKKKQFLSDGVKLRLKNYEIELPDSMHQLAFKELRINTATSAIYVDSLRVTPTLPRYEFSEAIGHETDRIKLYIDKGFLKKVDLRSLVDLSGFDADKLVLRGVELTAFRNKKSGLPAPSNHFPKLPRQLLRESKLAIDLDTLELREAKVVYEEHVENNDIAGHFSLNKANITVHNITNDPIKVSSGKIMDIAASCEIMNDGRLNVFFDLPLNSKEGEYYFEGILDSMSLESMNPFLEPVAFLKVRQGYARKIRFKVSGNNRFATGIMRLMYKRLKVSVINKKHKDGKLISFFANTFVVIRNNPRRLIVRKGRMYFKRDTTRSIFHYWAHTMLSGVKSSIGIKSKEKPDKEARKNLLAAVAEKFKLEGLAERKAERERKKKLREKLKEQRKEGLKNDKDKDEDDGEKDGEKTEDKKNNKKETSSTREPDK